MSEVEALLALYGAIDQAVVDHKVDSADLAPLLGAYRDGAATGWYKKQYLPWLAALHGDAMLRPPLDRLDVERDDAEREGVNQGGGEQPKADRPDVEPARDVLDEIQVRRLPIERPVRVERPRPPAAPPARDDIAPYAQEIGDALRAFPPAEFEGRTAARRLLAVTVAARAFPEVFGRDGSQVDAATNTLVFHEPGADDGLALQRAEELHARFVDEFTSMSAWSAVVTSSVESGLLPDSFLSQAAAPPCTGQLKMVPDPSGKDPDPCTVLESEFTTSDASFDDLKRYLEPENWQYPGSFWCRMERGASLGTNTWLYHETVATSCPPETALWTVSTDLQFWFSHPTATEARAEYDFPPGLPTPQSDINVDEGSLRVIQLPDGSVNVKTTKRVRFNGPLDGAGLAMVMCATGYSSIVEDLVFSIAADPTKQLEPFPVPAPQGGVVSPPAKKTAAKATAKEADESLDDLIGEAAEYAATYLKDVADTCTTSLKSVEAGTYKVENAWADGMKLWSTYLTGLGKALDLGTRTAQAFAKKSGDET